MFFCTESIIFGYFYTGKISHYPRENLTFDTYHYSDKSVVPSKKFRVVCGNTVGTTGIINVVLIFKATKSFTTFDNSTWEEICEIGMK